jgi:hypothetical protein
VFAKLTLKGAHPEDAETVNAAVGDCAKTAEQDTANKMAVSTPTRLAMLVKATCISGCSFW